MFKGGQALQSVTKAQALQSVTKARPADEEEGGPPRLPVCGHRAHPNTSRVVARVKEEAQGEEPPASDAATAS